MHFQNYVHKAPKLLIGDVVLSGHSIQRALDMAIDADEIRRAVEEPKYAWVSRKHEAWMFRRGRVDVGLREHWTIPGKWAVTTFLWSSAVDWMADAMTAPLPDGRTLEQTLERMREDGLV